ncbi:hypothetical protein ACFQ2H_33705 [Streptomyces violaceoruber]
MAEPGHGHADLPALHPQPAGDLGVLCAEPQLPVRQPPGGVDLTRPAGQGPQQPLDGRHAALVPERFPDQAGQHRGETVQQLRLGDRRSGAGAPGRGRAARRTRPVEQRR